MRVYLSDQAFVALTVAAVEVYKRECFGYLLGHMTDDACHVDLAVPLQSAERKFMEVSVSTQRVGRVGQLMDEFHRWRKVGDFHSHPDYAGQTWEPILSDTDVATMGKRFVSVVISLHETGRRSHWKYDRKGNLSGTVSGYRLKMSAYYRGITEGSVRQVALLCPFAVSYQREKTVVDAFARPGVNPEESLKIRVSRSRKLPYQPASPQYEFFRHLQTARASSLGEFIRVYGETRRITVGRSGRAAQQRDPQTVSAAVEYFQEFRSLGLVELLH
ncbi:MAG: Mov34/MPN/PAD-1 family protein [Deltaproteobacteria bacterium]|nr:Mov34/MPN/PAD-1 family protein [Deltaproteobacteria bacterium]